MDAGKWVRSVVICLFFALFAISKSALAADESITAAGDSALPSETATEPVAAEISSETVDEASLTSAAFAEPGSMTLMAAMVAPGSISYPSSSTSGSYDVSWSPVSGAGKYELQEQKGTASWVTVATILKQSTVSKTLTGRTNGSYKYRVRACPFDGTCSSYTTGSTTLTVSLLAPTASLSVSPSSIAAGGQSSLSWTSANAAACTLDGTSVATAGSVVKTNITVSTTYTLVCSNPLNSATSAKTVTVVLPPAISSFSASPNPVARGSTTTLTWAVSNSPTCTVDGTTRTSPYTPAALSADKTFTLACSNAAGSDTRQLLVSAPPLPVISSFTAATNPLETGTSTNLSWVASNATQCKVNGTTRTSPWNTGVLSATTNYSLVCSNVSGSDSESLTLTVGPRTVLNSYTADANPLASGQSTTLRWNVSNATGNNCSLNNGIGTVAAVGSVSTGILTASKSYRLQCAGVINSIDQTLTISVTPAPTITSFTAAKNPVAIGSGTTLSWATSNATSCSLYDGASTQSVAVNVTSRATGNLSASRTYRLTCTGTNNASVQRDLTVVATAAPVATLAAAYGYVETGSATTLTWTSDNASSCSLNGAPLANLDGSMSTGALTATKVFTLDCTSAVGSVQKSVTINVVPLETLWRTVGQ